MSIRLRLSSLALLCCLLAACMARTLPAADALAAGGSSFIAGPAWQLVVTQSGGFAGIELAFTADSANETLVVADRVRRTTTSVKLTSAEKTELAQSVAQLAGGPEVELRSAACRDCYLYEMTRRWGRASHAGCATTRCRRPCQLKQGWWNASSPSVAPA